MKKTSRQIILFMTALILSVNCDLNIGGGSDPDPNPATEILGFSFSPNYTVSVGDSLTIKVIVKDSLDKDLRYSWGVGIHASQYSELNSISFKVLQDSGTVSGGVTIQKLNSAHDNVSGSFKFNIKK